MYEVAPDLNEELIARTLERLNLNRPLKDKWVCGFRLHQGVYVAELICDKVTDKLDHDEVDFTLNIYELSTQEKEKVSMRPKLPGEERVRQFMLPKKELVLTRSVTQEIPKEE